MCSTQDQKVLDGIRPMLEMVIPPLHGDGTEVLAKKNKARAKKEYDQVASAVPCAAHEFVVETERAETRVSFNGILPSPDRLPELFSFILKAGPHPA